MQGVLPEVDSETGEPRLGELPDPVPGAGEVLIEVRATALNQADLLQMRGLYPPPKGESPVPGLECAGVIVEVGPRVGNGVGNGVGKGVEGFAAGMRVMALLAGGGHATHVVAPLGQLMPIPENLSFVEAAALPEAALTSWTNLVAEGRLKAGESVLVLGAASGVGTMTVQVARELGARVLVAGRDLKRLERLRALGASGACRLGEEMAGEVRKLNRGRGVQLVFDLVGGPALGDHLACLEEGGRLVLIGLMAGPQAELNLGQLMRRRLRLMGSVLRGRSRQEKSRLVTDFWQFAQDRLVDGRLKPVVDRVLPFATFPDAYAALARGGVLGKVVVENPKV